MSIICKYCGAKLEDNEKFCSKCGKTQDEKSKSNLLC